MTRIGFAYNQKPSAPERFDSVESSLVHGDIELPDNQHDPRTFSRSLGAGAHRDASPRPLAIDDQFAEWDSIETIDAVAHALAPLGDVVRLEASPDFPLALRDARPDIVFNIAEGLRGPNRESHVPAICEFFDVPYSGSDPFTLSLCLDKSRTKEVLGFHGVPTAAFMTIDSSDDLRTLARGDARLTPPTEAAPLFLKPAFEGSSKGITERNLVRSVAELMEHGTALLHTYGQTVIAETYLPGREFTCGVLGNGRDAAMLPIVELNFASLPAGAIPIYGFEAKWIWDQPHDPLQIFECPARVPDALRSAIEDVVLRAYRVLGCLDWSRIDVRLDTWGVPHIIEVNPLPGILPDPADNSCLPKAARAAGIAYDELIQRCLRHAAARTHTMLGASPRRKRARAS